MTEIMICEPGSIEKKSFEIITSLLGDRTFPAEQEGIIKRAIHTSADFDYADNLIFSSGAVPAGIAALEKGCTVYTDTRMAFSGVNQKNLTRFHCEKACYIDDPAVAAEAKEKGVTRAAVAMEKAAAQKGAKIFAIGNAPTALIALYDMIKAGGFRPDLIIGVPVGFVNVVESKELITTLDIPFIVAKGRKGGSNIAAAIVNGLMLEAMKKA
jgi:precorrin-8X/cobalt-precorrin-8 methylmutase